MSFFTKTTKLTYGTMKRLPAMAMAATVGWLGYTAVRKREEIPLPDPFASKLTYVDTLEAGKIAIHESTVSANSGATPVLLVHGVNAAASSFEMQPIFQRVEHDRPVVAMDLPGFGHSERTSRIYSPQLMADGVAAALDRFDGPAHVVALSLGSEFAALACFLRPDRVKSLTLISPTGFGRSSRKEERTSSLTSILQVPIVGQGLFDLLITRPSIEYFLAKSFHGEVDPAMTNFALMSGRQAEARHAPIAFLTGRLFSADALNTVYQRLTLPTLVLYDEDAYTDFADLPEFVTGGSGNRLAERISGTRGLPHFDSPDATIDAMQRFWRDNETT